MHISNNDSAVLVAGATGYLGTEICRQLIAKNKKVIGLVRTSSDAGKVENLKALGVQIREGDLRDVDSLKKAVHDVSAVISTVSSTLSRQEGDSIESVDERGQINLVDASIAAGVGHFIYISLCQLDDCPLQDAKRAVEKHLTESGMMYTILQPTYFMEVWLSPVLGFDYPNAKANIFGEGNNKVSWIAIRDVAAFAVHSLDNDAAKNRMIGLGGPEALSPLEVVDIFEQAAGKKFELQFVPEPVLRSQMEEARDPLSKTFATLTMGVVNGSVIDMTPVLADFPIELTAVNEYASGSM